MLVLWAYAAAPHVTLAEPTVTGLKPIELPEGGGKDHVEAYCGACHSLRLVLQQRLSRRDWDEVMVSMVQEQGMSEIPPGDRTLILDYLAKHVGLHQAPRIPAQP
ncbi:MAG: hypothetical protein GY877_05790 [Hyphomicrobium sp.]|nr:hypothetical protein [Hyphomicrobium sp.]